jgi:hypothetical protein
MNRRRILAVSGSIMAAALAGCIGGGCTRGADVEFKLVDTEKIVAEETTSAFDNPPMMDELPIITEQLLTETLAGGEPEVETLSQGPLDWLTYIEHNGGFYEITEQTISEGTVSGPEYQLARNSDTDADFSASDALSFADLPPQDQWRVIEAVDYNVEWLSSISESSRFVGGYLDSEAQSESVLAAGVDAPALLIDDNLLKLTRDGEDDHTAQRHRYTADRVATDQNGFVDYILQENGARLPELSENATTLLETTKANGGETDVCLSGSDENVAPANQRTAVDELRTTLSSLETNTSREQVKYVQYNGEWYRIQIGEWVV